MIGHHPARKKEAGKFYTWTLSVSSTGQLYCTFETIHYSRGQTFTSSDGCQQCTCGNHGRVSCQARPCNRLPGNIGIPRNLGIQGFHDNTGIQLPLQPRPGISYRSTIKNVCCLFLYYYVTCNLHHHWTHPLWIVVNL